MNTFVHLFLALWVALCFGKPPAGASQNHLAPPGSAPSHSCIYLYAHANPVNMIDPSGNAVGAAVGLAGITVGVGASTGTRASYEASRTPVYVSGIARAKMVVEIAAFAAIAIEIEIAEDYVIERTGLRDWIQKAKDIWRNTQGNRPIPKIVPIPAAVIPAVATHVSMAQASGQPALLQRAPIGRNIINRARALTGLGPAGVGQSWDEYPFASSMQGGRLNVSVSPVPLKENLIQGGIIAASYYIENIDPHDWFEVIVVP